VTLFTLSAGALNGLLLGGVYAIAVLGLSMVLGVMRLVNVAHGELLVLGAYISLFSVTALGIDPLLATLIGAVALFIIGYLLQLYVFNPVMERGVEAALLTAFGLSIIAQSFFLFFWTTNTRSINASYAQKGLEIAGFHMPLLYLVSFGLALVLIIGVHLFMTHTYMGKAIRASTQDPKTALVMGINVRKVYALTFAIAAATAALGGTLIGMMFSFDPHSGLPWLLKGFVIVVLGGMGSIVGTLAGALLLGVAEGVGAAIVGTGYRDMIGLIIFLIVLVAKPTGLFGRSRSV
jgi:branched-chain amino acid transport system permease protein